MRFSLIFAHFRQQLLHVTTDLAKKLTAGANKHGLHAYKFLLAYDKNERNYSGKTKQKTKGNSAPVKQSLQQLPSRPGLQLQRFISPVSLS